MDVLTDDHEREEVVRKWWHDNWLSLTVGIVIAIGGLVGYRQYQSYVNETSAENAYKMSALQTQLVINPTEGVQKASEFISEHEDIYGSLLSLDLAAVQAKEGKLDEAYKSAMFAVKNGGKLVSPNAAVVAASVLTEQKKFDEAVALLDTVKTDAYAIEKQELLGDIYVAQGKTDSAHDAYLKAIELSESKKQSINPLLQMKFDSLIKDGEEPAFKRAAALEKEIQASASDIRK
ncbi:MAG: YfgM family protein [Succinivibrio sp.]